MTQFNHLNVTIIQTSISINKILQLGDQIVLIRNEISIGRLRMDMFIVVKLGMQFGRT